ncbi:MAG TPA: PH domain-containing protein [Chloroflexia bacterium]|nr:PH domain-containing protein [Chloroflexia bacterium]
MAFCTVCGWKYDGDPKFCQQCGTPQGGDPAAASAAAAVGGMPMAYSQPAQSSEPQTWLSEEHEIWQGKSIDVITAGSLSPNRYRLTTRSLFYSHGRIGSVEKSVPLWAVRTVTVEQKLMDKARSVGDLVIHVQHDDWTEGVDKVRMDDIENPQEVRDLILKQAREENFNYERRQQTMFYQGRLPGPPR